RSGTESLTAIAALGAAAVEADKSLSLRAERTKWRDAMEARMKAAVPGIKVFGVESARLPQTSYIGLPGTLAETQVIALDLAGFAVSAGSACSSGKVHQSHVLTAMGMSEAEARCAIRVSFGWGTQEADLKRFTDTWATQLNRSLMLRRAQHEGNEKNESLILSLSKDERDGARM
ncbi:MAG: aminotransferase class V-fold PLP-dependent enzyme, partial [Alphaproteobacteria bacterium]